MFLDVSPRVSGNNRARSKARGNSRERTWTFEDLAPAHVVEKAELRSSETLLHLIGHPPSTMLREGAQLAE